MEPNHKEDSNSRSNILQVNPATSLKNTDNALTVTRNQSRLTPLPDPNVSNVGNLKSRARNSINTPRDLLTKMMAPTSSHDLTDVHVGYIENMTSLTYSVAIELHE